jgi:outer membrane receptor protein involved in Fe transport
MTTLQVTVAAGAVGVANGAAADEQVQVVSGSPRSFREAPGVVSVITREDIRASGARDLVDVLRLVPGLDIALDVEGALGPGVRGLWGTEGKVLFLVDGHEMNERFYGTWQIGPNLPLDLVERIEIQRGPGSVIYGGFAELAVVRITTRGGDDLAGLELRATAGAMGTTPSRAGLTGAAALRGEDTWLVASAHVAEAVRSDANFVDSDSTRGATPRTFDMGEHAGLSPRWFTLSAGHGPWRLSLAFDDYSHETRAGYGETLERTETVGFLSFFARAQGTLSPTTEFQVVPHVAYKRQSPWAADDTDLVTFSAKTSDRSSGGAELRWLPILDTDVLLGVELAHDLARLDDPRQLGTQRTFDGEQSFESTNLAVFGEVFSESLPLTVVAGARGEWSSAYDAPSLVPRIALMRGFGPIWAKVLYASAFRAPAFENLGLNPDIEPERARTYELEVGWSADPSWTFVGNLFDITLIDPIVFRYDAVTDTENYRDGREVRSQGFELAARVEYERPIVDATYANNVLTGHTLEAENTAPGYPQEPLGLAGHKGTLGGRLRLPAHLTLASHAVATSARRSSDGTSGDARLLWNVNLLADDLGLEGLSGAFAVFDVLNAGERDVQAHRSGHAPLPGPSREFVLRLAWTSAL